ncbi:MAG: hypothetical protein GXO55_03100 [Chloroflexi bacterium]|nr:hypothetical protein [Chloroflexota bacterium]
MVKNNGQKGTPSSRSDTWDIMTIFRIQEEETPPVLSLQVYKEKVDDPQLWQQSGQFLKKTKRFETHRIGRWLHMQTPRVLYGQEHTLLVLDREGELLWGACSCPRRSGQLCVHMVSLIRLWATSPHRFTPLHLYKNHPLTQRAEVVVPKFALRQNAIYRPHDLYADFASELSSELKMDELRDLVKQLGLSVKTRRKIELAKALVPALMDPEQLRARMEALDPLQRLLLFFTWMDPRSEHLEWLASIVKYFLPETQVTPDQLQNAMFRLFDRNTHIWWAHTFLPSAYTYLLLYVQPDLYDLAPWSVAVEAPESHEPTISASPWLPLRALFRLPNALRGKGSFTFPQVPLPKGFPQDLYQQYPRLWHLDWIAIRDWSVGPTMLPIFPHSITLPPDRLRILAERLHVSETTAHLLVWTSLIMGLTGLKKGQLHLKSTRWTDFLAQPRGVQLRHVWHALLKEIAHEALARVQRHMPVRLVGGGKVTLWISIHVSIAADRLLRTLLAMVATAPREHWIPLAELQRLFRPWADPNTARLAFYGLGTDPPDDWPAVFERWWQTAFRLAAHMGLLEIVEEDGQLTHVRHLHLRELLAYVDVPLRVGEQHTLSEDELDIRSTRAGLRVLAPFDAPQELMDLLEAWGAEMEVTRDRLAFQLYSRKLLSRFGDELSLESMAREWEDRLGFPLPEPLRAYLERLYRYRDSVRVYPKTAIIRFTDAATRRQVEAVVPELQDPTIPLLDERTLMLPADVAKRVLKTLEKSGYVPLVYWMEA